MNKIIEVAGLKCSCSVEVDTNNLAYILYPMEILDDWIGKASKKYGTSIVVITGMDWQNVFSPWPSKGVPAGTPDFKGESPEFLKLLQTEVLPAVEQQLNLKNVRRTLFGVSMSGLFALWQWMLCDTFFNIASLSGSFWYEGFLSWIQSQSVPHKTGKAFFLLGKKEAKSPVRAFDTVETNTKAILELLKKAGISTEFEIVPGDHYSNPLPRLERSFEAIFKN